MAGGFGQSVELFFVGEVEGEGFIFFQQILRELQCQPAGLFGEGSELFFSGIVEQGTAAHKAVVAVFE